MIRGWHLALLLMTAACGEATREQADAETIACAPDGAADFSARCGVARAMGPEGLMLTLTAPDGGFRRLRVTTDGRGVVAADGVEAAQVTIVEEGLIEVAIGDDRYRLPARAR